MANKARVVAAFAGLNPNGAVARADGTILSIGSALDALKVLQAGSNEDRRLLRYLWSRDPATGTLVPFFDDVRALSTEITNDVPDGWWRLGEASGVFADSSAGGHPSTSIVGGTRGTSALDVGGDGSYTTVGSSDLIKFGNNFQLYGGDYTIEFLFKGTLGGTNPVGKYVSADTEGWAFAFQADGRAQFWRAAGGTLYTASSTSGVVVNGQTNHIAVTYVNSTRTMTVYVNSAGWAIQHPVGINSAASNATEFAVGAQANNSQRQPGIYDEVAIYANKALSADRIAAHYIAAVSGP